MEKMSTAYSSVVLCAATSVILPPDSERMTESAPREPGLRGARRTHQLLLSRGWGEGIVRWDITKTPKRGQEVRRLAAWCLSARAQNALVMENNVQPQQRPAALVLAWHPRGDHRRGKLLREELLHHSHVQFAFGGSGGEGVRRRERANPNIQFVRRNWRGCTAHRRNGPWHCCCLGKDQLTSVCI